MKVKVRSGVIVALALLGATALSMNTAFAATNTSQANNFVNNTVVWGSNSHPTQKQLQKAQLAKNYKKLNTKALLQQEQKTGKDPALSMSPNSVSSNTMSSNTTISPQTSSFPYYALATGDMVYGHNGNGWWGDGYGYWVHTGIYSSSSGEYLSAEPNQGVIWQPISHFTSTADYSQISLTWIPSSSQSKDDNLMYDLTTFLGKPYSIWGDLVDTSSWYCSKLAPYGYFYFYPSQNITDLSGLSNYTTLISPDDDYNGSLESVYYTGA